MHLVRPLDHLRQRPLRLLAVLFLFLLPVVPFLNRTPLVVMQYFTPFLVLRQVPTFIAISSSNFGDPTRLF